MSMNTMYSPKCFQWLFLPLLVLLPFILASTMSDSDRICLQFATLTNAQRKFNNTAPILKSVKLDAAAAFQSMMMMQYQNLSHVVGDEPDFMVRVQGSFFRTKNNVIYEKICQPSGGSSSAFVPFTMASADSTHMGCNVAGPDMNGAHWMTVIFAISDGSELGAEYSADPNLSLQDAASVATNNMQEMLQAQLKQQLEASLSKAMSQGSSMLPPGFQSIPSTGQAMPIAPNNGQPSSNNNFGASFFTNPQPMTFQPLIFH